MDTKKIIAETLTDFTINGKDYFGKSQKEIMAKLKNKNPGIAKDVLENWSTDLYKVCEKFAGKGAEEIKIELGIMSTAEVDDFLIIAKRWTDPL